MVGRNDKCPCGSGRKYKVCCLGKVVQFSQPELTNFSHIPGDFVNIEDPKLEKLKENLKEFYSFEKKNPQFLYEISLDLGLLGYPKDGIIFAERGLKYCSKKDIYLKNSLLVNLAAMSAEIDQHETGLRYLSKVPDGSGRKAVIEANIRKDLEPFENVIHLYEQAIQEEPDFFLPYEHLISRLKNDDPKREFLIEKAVKNMPQNPRALLFWVDKKLMERNYELLSDKGWIEKVRDFNLDKAPDYGTVGFAHQLPNTIGVLELIHEASRLMYFHQTSVPYDSVLKHKFKDIKETRSTISDLIESFLPVVEDQFRCNISKNLVDVSIAFGDQKNIETAISNICPNCLESMKPNQLRFSCYYRRIKQVRKFENSEKDNAVQETLSLAEKILKEEELYTEDFVNSLFDFLDDEISSQAVLEYAEKIFDPEKEKVEFSDQYEKIRLYWNLGIIAGKANSWSLSETFFDSLRQIDIEKTLKDFEDGTYIESSKFNSKAINTILENLTLIDLYVIIPQLGQKKLIEANQSLNQFKSKLGENPKYNKLLLDFEDLLRWVSNSQESDTFKNDFRQKLKQVGLDIWIGDKPKIKKFTQSVSELFPLFNKDDISSKIKIHETLSTQESIQSSDLSEVINYLEELIPNFRMLPDNARTSLISAEAYQLNDKNRFDTAPSIMGYCKALEIYLKTTVFGQFVSLIKSSDTFDQQIEQARADPKFPQFRSLISFISSGFLELGGATQCLKLCNGKTSLRVEILGELNQYILNYYKPLSSKDVIDKIEILSKNYRNPAVHEATFQPKDIDYVKNIVTEILNMNLSLRSV